MDANVSEARIARLLAHSEWLSALARSLVRDPALAEDLVQDTWALALRAPPADLRSERGWLATLIANLARVRARTELARADRERRAAVEERIDGPHELVERADAQRRLLAHVLALDEPYRGTLLARFVEARSAADIARRTGVNESTVRTRLARALVQLRERLAREESRDSRLGLGALLAGWDPGAGSVETGAGLGTLAKATKLATGAWIMGTKAKLGLAAVAALLVWFAWRELGAEVSPLAPEVGVLAERSREPEPLPAGDPAPSVERRALEQAAVAPVPEPESSPAEPPPQGKQTLDIVFLREESPVQGVTAWILPSSAWSIPWMDLFDVHTSLPAGTLREVSNGAGVAAFRQLKAGRFALGYALEPNAVRPSRMVAGELFTAHRYEVRLGSAGIHGRVFDVLGHPLAGVGIQVSTTESEPRSKLGLYAQTVTNERGEYRIDGLMPQEQRVVMEPDGRFDGRGEVQRKRVALAAGEVKEVDFGSALPGTRWSGRVLNAFEEPFLGTPRLVIQREDESQQVVTQVGTDGKFELSFDPGTWRVVVFATGCSDAGFHLGAVELPNSDVVRDIVIPGTRVQGLVVPVDASQPLDSELVISLHPKGHEYPAAFRSVNVTGEGRYSIDGLEPGVWVFGTFPGQLAPAPEIVIVEGMRSLEQDLRWTAP